MDQPKSNVVKGVYLRHSDVHGFLYQHTCRCGRKFINTSPELSEPVLCHNCYIGRRKKDQALRDFDKGKVPRLRKIRRKYKETKDE